MHRRGTVTRRVLPLARNAALPEIHAPFDTTLREEPQWRDPG